MSGMAFTVSRTTEDAALDDRENIRFLLYTKRAVAVKQPLFSFTGDERIELPPKVLETPIIPFDQSPILLKSYLQNSTQK